MFRSVMVGIALLVVGTLVLEMRQSAQAQSAPPAGRAMPAGNYAQIALDPAASGISAVNSAGDLLRNAGPDQGLAYFNGVLEGTRNPSVARMIRFQLVDLYKEANRPDKALEVLKDIMVMTPANATGPTATQVIQLSSPGGGDAPVNNAPNQ